MATQTVPTSRFGEIQVENDRVISFVEPVLGFNDSKEYILLDHAENSPFKWLQSLQEPDLAFVVTNPRFFGIDYEFTLEDEFVEKLAIQSADDPLVLTIVNIPSGNPSLMTANLMGPVVINQNSRAAMQVVLVNSDYTTKTRLLPDEALAANAAAASQNKE